MPLNVCASNQTTMLVYERSGWYKIQCCSFVHSVYVFKKVVTLASVMNRNNIYVLTIINV